MLLTGLKGAIAKVGTFIGRFTELPLFCTVYYFPSDSRWASFKKFVVLWILSVLPFLFAGLRRPVGNEDNAFLTFASAVVSEFESKSSLIFSISFLVPILYLAYDRLKLYTKYAFSRKQAPREVQFPLGFDLVLFLSTVVFLLTAFIYGSEPHLAGTVLASILSYGLVYIIYLYALYCWYLSMLMAEFEKRGPDFVGETRQQEQTFKEGLSHRLERKTEEEESNE